MSDIFSVSSQNHRGSGVACRYYNRGRCFKGTSCPYSHAPDQYSLRSHPECVLSPCHAIDGALTFASPEVIMYVCISSTMINADTRNNNATIHIDEATSIGAMKSSKSIWQRPSLTRGRKTRKSERGVPRPTVIVVETSLLAPPPCQCTLHIQFAERRDRPIDTQSPSRNSHHHFRAFHGCHGCHYAYQRSRDAGSMKWPSV
jgi:hypothetical protein